MKTIEKKHQPELVRAAQLAGADEQSQEFWRQVAAHSGQREARARALVEPRNLTEHPKNRTI